MLLLYFLIKHITNIIKEEQYKMKNSRRIENCILTRFIQDKAISNSIESIWDARIWEIIIILALFWSRIFKFDKIALLINV